MAYAGGWLRRALCAILFLALASCGGGGQALNPVRGKVMHKGAGVAGALVVFHPRDQTGVEVVRPSGVTGPDGDFSLTAADGPGAAAGEYDVTVVVERQGKGEKDTGGDPFRGRYHKPATSGLRATVQPGPNELPAFELQTPGPIAPRD